MVGYPLDIYKLPVYMVGYPLDLYKLPVYMVGYPLDLYKIPVYGWISLRLIQTIGIYG